MNKVCTQCGAEVEESFQECPECWGSLVYPETEVEEEEDEGEDEED